MLFSNIYNVLLYSNCIYLLYNVNFWGKGGSVVAPRLLYLLHIN